MADGKVASVTGRLAGYLSDLPEPPAPVLDRAVLHVLDTFGAMYSGGLLPAGRAGVQHVAGMAGPVSATVLADGATVAARYAALANGMAAHADETDDSHAPSLTHPGCAIVPAALAVAEGSDRSGPELLRAVVAGYDVCGRITRALGIHVFDGASSEISSHAVGGVFGAAVACGVLHQFGPDGMAATLSYAAQLAAGATTWLRDEHHIQKAFVFGGMPAWHGVAAAEMVMAGLPGVPEVFDQHPNFLHTYRGTHDFTELVDDLGERFVLLETTIKRHAVGSPAQAAVQAAIELLDDGVTADSVASIEIRLPTDLVAVVNARRMSNINVQYLVAGTLLDGRFSFDMAHDENRMDTDMRVAELVSATSMVADASLDGRRQAIVTLATGDGRERRRHVAVVRGTPDDPMDLAAVEAKVDDLLHGTGLEVAQIRDYVLGLGDATSAATDLPSMITDDPAKEPR